MSMRLTGMGRLGDGFDPLTEGPVYNPNDPSTYISDNASLVVYDGSCPFVDESLCSGAQPPPNESLDVVSIGAAPTNATELKNLIHNSGGSIVVANNDVRLLVANQHSWEFSVTHQADGQFKIVSTDYSTYLIYGGIALVAIVALTMVAKR